MENTTLDSQERETFYFKKPSLVIRVKELLIDAVFIIVLMGIMSAVLENLNVVSGQVRGGALLMILLYEPILIITGGTIGHRIMGLRVKASEDLIEKKEPKNINIIFSLLRYVVKILLGWVSLMTITSDKLGQAIHDKVGGSVVTFQN
jgi:uncharacterized RDD family membrane protein YckC